ncbi:MAG: arylsulfatase [Pirellulaceae bacterium]|nr:arylsulfatase [Pirellulaceae bacterium]
MLAPATLANDQNRPNIIFIMADDMGYGDAGCYGQQQIQTPHIDRLAAEGMRFRQCYAGSTVCAPSRSVLMTGLHTGHTRVRGNTGRGGVVGLGGKVGRVPLRAEDITVAELLKSAGYKTAMVGKWGLGEPLTSGVPNKQGFDSFFGYLNQRRAHSYFPTYLWLNQHRFELPGNRDGRQQQYSHDLVTAHALHAIRDMADQRFFLYLPYTIPHDRFEIPDLGPYADRDWTETEKTYAAMITRMDSHLGNMLDLLAELGIEERTIVFFCSDNGAANRYEGIFDSSGPLRGRKRDMYEGGLRTPMIVRWPNRIQAGAVNDTVWSFQDFLPTAAELAGVTIDHQVDGESILGTLLGNHQNLKDRFHYWEFHERGFQQAARWQDWKVVRPGRNQALELYNLKHDLGETKDIAKEHRELIRQFETNLAAARTESQEWPLK